MYDFTGLKDFGRYLTFKSKRKLTFGAILLSVIPTTVLFYFPLEFRYLYVVAFLGLSIVPLHSIVNLITGSVLLMARAFLYNRKHKPQKMYFPEIKQIAAKMGLDYDRPICVTKNPAVKSAFVNLSTKNITIPSSSFKEFHRTEILAEIGHELGHIKHNGTYMKEMILASTVTIGLFFGLIIITQCFGLGYIPLIAQIGSYCVMILMLSYVFWRNELRADEESAKVIGAAPLISVFELFQSQVKRDEGSETHPPLHERIKRLEKFLKTQDN